ncbi:ECF transporter S component [Cellulomonas telluris]|uniref:ECF transporter S component n=1 Tax=Cellulomonas telluris TaxID=2306636 RepID=UPI0014562854|nr:ECF transporter S component [Cellulomonas telluris]
MTGPAPGGRTRAAVLAGTSAVGAGALCWPLLTAGGRGGTATPWAVGTVALLAVVVVLAVADDGDGGLDARTAALVGTLAASGCVLRLVSPGIGGVELVFAVLLVGGYALGASTGFVLGVVTLLVSALLTGGVGPWLPFQALAAGWVGTAAGVLGRRRRSSTGPPSAAEVASLVALTVVACLAYGVVMNLWSWPFLVGEGTALSYDPGAGLADNLRRFAVWSLVSSGAWDGVRAGVNAVVVAATARRVVASLRRVRRTGRYADVHEVRRPTGPDGPDA